MDEVVGATAPPPATTSPTEGDRREDEPIAEEDVEAMLERLCGACHGAAASASGDVKGGFDFVGDLERLVDAALIVPQDSANSLLIQQMRGGSMPPGNASPRPTPEEIQCIADYIDWSGTYLGTLHSNPR